MSCYTPPDVNELRNAYDVRRAYDDGYRDGMLDMALRMGKQRAQERGDALRRSGGRATHFDASGVALPYRR